MQARTQENKNACKQTATMIASEEQESRQAKHKEACRKRKRQLADSCDGSS